MKKTLFLGGLILALGLGWGLVSAGSDEFKKVPRKTGSAGDSAEADMANVPPFYLADKKGEVSIISKDKDGKEKKRSPKPPEVVVASDRIITGKKGQAFLQFRDGGNVEVGPNSEVLVAEIESDGPDKDFKASFQLYFGKIKAIVAKLATPASKFEVKAGGVVSGVRGTQFEVEYDQARGEVTTRTFDGEVWVKTELGKENKVKSGFKAFVGADGLPVSGSIDSADIKDFLEFINIAGDLDKKRKIIFKQLEKRYLEKLTNGVIRREEDGKRSLGIGGFGR